MRPAPPSCCRHLVLPLLLTLVAPAAPLPVQPPENATEAAGCPEACRCLPAAIDCANADLAAVPGDLPASAVHLNLHNNSLTSLGNITLLPNLSSLDLSLNQLESFPLLVLDQLPSLEYLNVSRNRLGDWELEEGALVDNNTQESEITSSNIVSLDLSYNNLSKIPNCLLNNLPTLSRVFLHNNQIYQLNLIKTARVVNALPYNYTNGTNSSIIVLNNTALFYPSFPNITQLSLASNAIAKVQVGFFDAFPHLEELDLSDNRLLNLAGLWTIKLDHLAFLNLNANPFSDIPNGALQACNNLDHLYLAHLPNLTHLNGRSLGNLSHLETLDLSSNPSLHYIHGHAFSELAQLRELNLSRTAISQPHESLFDNLTQLSTLDLTGIPIECNCNTAWLQTWLQNQALSILPANLTCAQPDGLAGVPVTDLSLGELNCTGAVINQSELAMSFRIGSSAVLDCIVDGKPSPSTTWVTNQGLRLTHHPAFVDHSDWEPSDPEFHRGHFWHLSNSYFHNIPVENRIFVLKNGSLFIDYVTREDGGKFLCLAKNHLGNESIVTTVTLNYEVILDTTIWSIIIGFASAIGFLILGLIAGMIRYFAHVCSAEEKEKRRSMWELLTTIAEFKSEKVDTFRAYRTEKFDVLKAYKSAKLHKISVIKNQRIDKLKNYKQATVTSILAHMHNMREHYQGQVGKVKDNYSGQVDKLRDNYATQIGKFKDYRSEKIDRIRDNYTNQALKIRDYGSMQMHRLRDQYKLQQQHLLKLLELLDIGNCMSVIEAECMRTDSMLFDPDLGFDLDQPVHVPRELMPRSPTDDSEYVTAGSQSDTSSIATIHVPFLRPKQHKRTSSDSSQTSSSSSHSTHVPMLQVRRKPRKKRRHQSGRHSTAQHSAEINAPPPDTIGVSCYDVPSEEEEEREAEDEEQQALSRDSSPGYESARQSSREQTPQEGGGPVARSPGDECVVVFEGESDKQTESMV